MAEIFRKSAGNGSVVCRYGGDEFIILIESANRRRMEIVADTIMEQMGKEDGFRGAISAKLGRDVRIDSKHQIGCSIAITLSDNLENCSIEKLIKEADDLLYIVKTKAKGTYRFI